MAEWVIIGVESGAPWPVEETKVIFLGKELVLSPETETVYPSVAMKFVPPLTSGQAVTICREFLSSLAWVENARIREIQIGGGGHLYAMGKGPRWSVRCPKFSRDYLPDPADKKAKLALALYREALSINSVPYQFLGFFKIINILFGDGKKQIQWINANLAKIQSQTANDRIRTLKFKHADLGEYLYGSGRCSVAHAFSGDIANPDSDDDLDRLNFELPVIKALAEIVIEFELGIKSHSTVLKEHLYELNGFKNLIPQPTLEALQSKTPTDISCINLPQITVGIVGKSNYGALNNMNVSVEGQDGGVLILRCTSQDRRVELPLGLDFSEERLRFDLFNTVAVNDDGTKVASQHLIDLWSISRDLILNGKLEIKRADDQSRLGRTDAYLPQNIDLDATMKNIEHKLLLIKQQMEHRS